MPAATRIAVQLYSLRDAIAADGLGGVLERVAGIGFDGVETAGLQDLTAAELARTLRLLGLDLAAAHVPLPDLHAATELLDTQEAAGATDLVVPFLPPDALADADGVRRAADRLNAFAEAAAARGMGLGYHNHFWEFATRIDGQSAHARLFENLVPAVFAEIDTYWVRVGGADPAAVVRGFADRAPLLHLKDGPADDPKAPMTALGAGAMDLPSVLAASHARWHIVELDRCAGDMWQAIDDSFRYLTGRREH